MLRHWLWCGCNEKPVLGVNTWTGTLDANAYLASQRLMLDSPMRSIVGITEKGSVMDIGYVASRGVVFNVPNPAIPVNTVPEPRGISLMALSFAALYGRRRASRS